MISQVYYHMISIIELDISHKVLLEYIRYMQFRTDVQLSVLYCEKLNRVSLSKIILYGQSFKFKLLKG